MRSWIMIILLSCSFGAMAQGLVWGGKSDANQSGATVIVSADSSKASQTVRRASTGVIVQGLPEQDQHALPFDDSWYYGADVDKYFVYVPGDCQLGAISGCTMDFMIGAYEVTNDQFAEFSYGHFSGKYKTADLSLPSLPVVNVSVDQAKRYAEWLSEKTGKKFRLPTLSEWEKASSIIAVDEYVCLYANFSKRESNLPVRSGRSDECDFGITAAASIGSLEPTQNGLYDIYGNVAEWVCRGNSSQQCSDASSFVAVGGSWQSLPSEKKIFSGELSNTVGFRLVQDL